MIHNDLKPENFVVIGARLKRINFVIASKIEEEKTSVQRDLCCGTINYMAPETIETYENEDFFKVSLRWMPHSQALPQRFWLHTIPVTEKSCEEYDEILWLQGRPRGGCRMREDENASKSLFQVFVSLVPTRIGSLQRQCQHFKSGQAAANERSLVHVHRERGGSTTGNVRISRSLCQKRLFQYSVRISESNA